MRRNVLCLSIMAIAGCGTGSSLDTAEWSVSGAISGSYSFDEEANFVSCIDSTDGLFNVAASDRAGGDIGFSFTVQDHFSPGVRDYTWHLGGGGPSGDVRVGRNRYWYFYDSSTLGSSERPATCTLTTESAGGTRIHGTLSCSAFPAQITSPDYDLEDAAGFRPAADLEVEFDCDPL